MTSELVLACGVVPEGEYGRVYCWSPFLSVDVRIRGWQVSPAELRAMGWDPDFLLWAEPTPELPKELEQIAREGEVFVAHNSDTFDAHVWSGLGYPPVRWADTMALCARKSLPRSLDNASRAVFGLGKDPLGHKLMLATSQPQRKGVLKGHFIPPDSPRLSAMARYCARDSLLCAALWFQENLGDPHPDDRVLAVHRRINDRGIRVDVEAAAKARLEDQRQKAAAIQRAIEATKLFEKPEDRVDADIFNSPVRIQRWLQRQGLPALDATKDTLEKMTKIMDAAEKLAGGPFHHTEAVKAVVEARLAVGSITGSKIDALLSRVCPDRRLRDMFVYYGAHTGRFSGRGVQVQNIVKAPVKVTEDVFDHPEHAPIVAREEDVTVSEVLGSMLRGFFTCSPGKVGLGVVDYASVEARVLLWCARDDAGLQSVREDDDAAANAKATGGKAATDAYRRLAAKIYRVLISQVTKDQRQAGKIGVLACGYQGGPDALIRMGSKMNIDLGAAGVTPEQVVEAWRDANPLVAGESYGTWWTPEGKQIVLRRGGIWRDCKAVAESIVRGFAIELEAARCIWKMEDRKHLVCVLPSGRFITYRNARYEETPTRFGGTAMAICFDHPRGYRSATYGGKLVENVVQAACRDLLTHAACELEDAGLEVTLHVHDELAFECGSEDDFHRGEAIIKTNPPWATGIPIAAEGVLSRRYTKP